MNRSDWYGPPNPWDDPRYMDRHRGMGSMAVDRGMPIDVEFLGWRSNTLELQRHGWQVAESQSPRYSGHGRHKDWHIQIRHPEYRMSGMSRPFRTHRSEYSHNGSPDIHLHIDIGLPYMTVQREPMAMWGVDCEPRHIEIRSPSDLYDMPYFRPLDEGKDLFLKRATVDEIMQIALDKQAPEQAEMRARRQQEQKRSDYRRGGKVEGRIILVA